MLFAGSQVLVLLVEAAFTAEDFVPKDEPDENEDPLPESEGEYQVMELSSTQRSAIAMLRECFTVDSVVMEAISPKWLPQLLVAAILAIASTRHAQELGFIAQEDGAETIDDVLEVSDHLHNASSMMFGCRCPI